MVNPADLPLPPFLDPLLDYLEDKVPPPFYGILTNTLSHLLALVSALLSLGQMLWANSPTTWDAQSVLPPVIVLLTSYLALMGVWRTTSWMFRSTFFLLKWGSILSFTAALAGWALANAAGNGNGGENGLGALGGMLGGAGGLLATFLAGQGGGNQGSSRRSGKSESGGGGKKKSTQERPKAWESFEAHHDWQYDEEQANQQSPDIEQYVQAAMKAAKDYGLWGMAQNFMGLNSERSEEESDRRKRRRRERDNVETPDLD